MARSDGVRSISAQRLYLLFSLGTDRYAVDVREVVQVLHVPVLKRIPEAPAWVSGLCTYQGQVIPVIDLMQRIEGRAAQSFTSTRLVIVSLPQEHAAPRQALGLVLEQATDTLRCAEGDFVRAPSEQQAPYLGAVLKHAQGLIQKIDVSGLVPRDMLQWLFSQAQAAEHD